MRPSLVGRNSEMIALRRKGLTLAEIGNRYGVTRERVAQITRSVPALDVRRLHYRRPKCKACGAEFGEPLPPSTPGSRYCSAACRSRLRKGLIFKHHGVGTKIIDARLRGVSWAALRRDMAMHYNEMGGLVWRELYDRGEQNNAELAALIWPAYKGHAPGGAGYRRAFLKGARWARELD